MAEVSTQEAIARARAAIGLEVTQAARAWRIRRLDRPGDDYYLVVFGEEQAAVAVAAVGIEGGEVRTSARLPGLGSHLPLDPEQASRLAGLGESAQVQLVWQPCRASRSPLYPLWEIRSASRTAYVDQQGLVWQELGAAGHGR
jgi:hypothetical protein